MRCTDWTFLTDVSIGDRREAYPKCRPLTSSFRPSRTVSDGRGREALLPLPRYPDPTGIPLLPLTFDPNRGRPWAGSPGSRYPHVIGSRPTPIPACPDIFSPRRGGLCFDLNGRWRARHDHLSPDNPVSLGLDDFTSNLRARGGHHRFGFTAGQQKRRQHDKVNFFFHRVLFGNRFSKETRSSK